ncbi:hypothetical protein BDQ12DRAFT_675194 [Crucibulum laeve]|uniref:Uncharacterized protein n=1 Tax=Crucibulum laeve TaxID=68775 RepID=A0A5C3MDU6_9AGAR|nr:hypothetical protein BDQ12DRAFT_675194 [Crucibulum laeve]
MISTDVADMYVHRVLGLLLVYFSTVHFPGGILRVRAGQNENSNFLHPPPERRRHGLDTASIIGLILLENA